jgi:hypothetical protein
MSELTTAGLVFLLLVVMDFAYYFALWINRIPKVDGYTVEPFNRHELTIWGHHCSQYDLVATFSPIKFVDSTIKYGDLAVEIELELKQAPLPDKLRIWLDGVKYDLCLVQSESLETEFKLKGIYSAIISQSDKITKRHRPIIESFG